jgi:peptide/nickel transport system ATP-binding protein
MNKKLLDVRNLETCFRTENGIVTAVNSVSFTAAEGEILGIVGESGCGKSVTALSIMQLLPESLGFINSGHILFDETDLLGLSGEEMRGIRGGEIAMVFQEPMTSLNPVLTIGYQIGEAITAHGRKSKKENRNKTISLLRKVGIPEPEKALTLYPHELSGGMRQRVMIAMALACEPRLLIADEPTTALDVTIQAQVLDLLKKLVLEDGKACILITHDLGVMAEMADTLLVMYAGRVVEYGEVASLFSKPKHPYTQGLIRSRPENFIKGQEVPCIKGMVPSINEQPPGCPFAPRCEREMAECSVRLPELIQLNENHQVRCLLYGELD